MSILYLLDSQLRTFVLLVKTDGVDSTSRTNNGRNATDLAAELGGEDMVVIQAALDENTANGTDSSRHDHNEL